MRLTPEKGIFCRQKKKNMGEVYEQQQLRFPRFKTINRHGHREKEKDLLNRRAPHRRGEGGDGDCSPPSSFSQWRQKKKKTTFLKKEVKRKPGLSTEIVPDVRKKKKKEGVNEK